MSIISAFIQPVTDILDKVIPDADTKQRIAHEIATQVHTIAQAQIEVNKAEAQSKDLFVAGWRPAVGWVTCLGMAGNFLVIPMANFALALSGSPIVIPLIDLSTMLPVLMGMLGLGGLRTYEKTRGVK
jgi:uncharacterized membrane protein